LRARSTSIQPVLDAVQANNEQILAIAAQVNMLAINAKIEAARAGEAGRGFSVVADAINELSARTGAAAQDVTQNVAGLTDELRMINDNALRLGDIISDVTRIGGESHRTLNIASRDFREAGQQARQVEQDSRAAQDKLAMFRPTVDRLDGLVRGGTDALTRASHRVTRLIDGSERLVQDSVALGGASRESRFIEEVQRLAAAISTAFEAGVDSGRISLRDLFDTDLRPVRGTDPQQFTTRFTRFTDQVLPPIQEPALDFDSRVVFAPPWTARGIFRHITANSRASRARTRSGTPRIAATGAFSTTGWGSRRGRVRSRSSSRSTGATWAEGTSSS
ncbi:MAG: methyl-accepting chemotaxis protein, partial [Pseudooceanicola sp.]